MILECEKCATRYLVDTSDIGVLGRMVRCAECGHDWYATTDGAKPSPAVEPAPAPTPAPDVAAEVQPTEPTAATGSTNLPAIVPQTDDRTALMVLFWGGMVLALAILYLVFGRAQIMAVWPPAQHAFAVLGLEEPVASQAPVAAADVAPALFRLQNLQIERIGSTVTLTGMVQNEGGVAGPLPSLTIIEYGAAGEAISTLEIALEADIGEIAPGENVPVHLVHGLADAAITRVRVSITEEASAP